MATSLVLTEAHHKADDSQCLHNACLVGSPNGGHIKVAMYPLPSEVPHIKKGSNGKGKKPNLS